MNKDGWIKRFEKPLVIGGPCSAESEEQVMKIASELADHQDYVQVYRAGIWKPRTKPNSFEGVGVIGLNWLKKVKDEYGFLITTEVANANHAKLALEFDVDILWIGARTTVNPFQVQEIAEAIQGTDKIVLIKNPVNPDLELWIGAFERFQGQGITKLGAIHRGFSTYKKTKYRNLPQWQIALEFMNRMPDIPIICDPSHIAGRRDLIHPISQQAFNYEYDGLMVETHCDPDNAWSDAKQQITPERLLEILKAIRLREHDDDDAIYHSKLERFREEIDETDHHILEALATRMKIAEEIGGLKKDHNVAVFQPQRWSEIKERVKEQGQSMGLRPEFISKILQALHQESVSVQNKVMNDQNLEVN